MKSFTDSSMKGDEYYAGGPIREVEMLIKVRILYPPGVMPDNETVRSDAVGCVLQPPSEIYLGIPAPHGGSYWARHTVRLLQHPEDLEIEWRNK